MISCQFCGKECFSKSSRSAHQRFCKLNPDYQKNIKKHAQLTSKAGAIKAGEASHKKSLQDPLNQIQTYIAPFLNGFMSMILIEDETVYM